MSLNLTLSDVPTHVVFWQDKKDNVSELVKALVERVASLEATVAKLVRIDSPLLAGIDIRRRENSIGSLNAVQDLESKTLFHELIHRPQPCPSPAPLDLDVYKPLPGNIAASVHIDEADEADEADDEGVDADEDEDEGVDADEDDDEEALELEEFQYKGLTYFKDSENQVYQVDADGDLDDTPIGVWNEEKQKVLKYAKA